MEGNNFSTTAEKCLFLSRSTTHMIDGPVYITTVFTCVVNCIFAITATTANSLMLYIIVKEPCLHTPTNILIGCLATSDLVIGAITQPAYVVYKVAELLALPANVSCVARLIHWVFGWICVGVSMLTITAIAVERYLALYLHLRYPAVVTSCRVTKVVITFWLSCIAIILSLFAIESDRYWTYIPAPILVLNIVVTVTSYWKIFRVLQRHRNQIRDQLALQVMGNHYNSNNSLASNHSHASNNMSHASSQASNIGNGNGNGNVDKSRGRGGLNIKRYRKSAVTAVYVSALLLLCYIPFFCAMVTRVIVGYSTAVKVAYECAATLVYMNSTINPALYWRRIPDIRRAVLRFLKQHKCWRRNAEDGPPVPSMATSVYHRGSRVSSLNL